MPQRRTPTERATFVARFRQSGLSATEFAAQAGVASSSLHRWMTEAPRPDASTFVRLEVERPRSGHLAVVVGEARVEVERGFDTELLREVVAALRGVSR